MELGDRYGEQSESEIAISLPISQEELSEWAGASRAGVAHALQMLRELGWIHTERGRIVIRNIEALRARSA